MLNLPSPQRHNYSTIFKTTLKDINNIAVAIDKISTMTLPDYIGLGSAIDGLSAKQAALVLSTRNLSQAELEEVVIQNNLLATYGAEELIKAGLLTTNSSLLNSEKAVSAEKLTNKILQSSLNEEEAKEFIQKQLIVTANGEESASTVLLNKALMDEAVKRGVLSEEKAAEILSTYGVVTADATETASKKSLAKATKELIASKIALSALDVSIIAGVSALVFTIYKCNKAVKEAGDKAQELGSTFKSTSSDIESYKSQIEELYSTINDSNSSIEDVTTARQTLMSVQDELIDKFGTEKNVINDVTEAINGQTEALDRLTSAKWQEIKNDFNNGGFWNNVANFFQGKDNIERMLDEYGEKTILFNWADYADINKLTDEMVAKLENIGIDIKVSTDNLQATRDFNSLTESIEDTKGASLALTGNAEEIYNKLLALQNLIGNDNSLDKLYDKVGNTADSYKELTDKYKDFYDQYILQEKILSDNSKYADTFKNITDAAEKYNEAFTSGDETKIKEAADEYADIVSSAMSTAIANGDSDVATYFENMYPTLKSIVNGWQFNVAFDTNTDDLQGKVQTVLDELKDENSRSLTAEEILGLGEENKQYQELVSIAHDYNMEIDEMIELLKERNLVSAMDYQGLVGLFGQENVDKLSPEDLEIAYTIENVGNMTFEELQAEIEKTKEIAEKPVSLSISETIDQLNTQIKPAFDSLQSAYQDIFSDDGKFKLNSIDILSTCDSIKSKLDDLNEINGISVDYSAFEDFVRVLNNTESTEKDVEDAFDSLATSITQVALSGAEDFETMKSALEDLGVVNSEMVAFGALVSNANALEEALVQANASMDDFIVNTEDGSVKATEAGRAFLEEKVGAENCAEALKILAFHKELCNLQEMNTAVEVANLKTLAENAGYTGEVIQYLTELEQIYQEVASGTLTKEQILAKTGRATLLKTLIDSAASNINYAPKTDFSGAVKDAKSAGSKAGDAYVDAFEDELKDLQSLRDSGVIDEAEYLRRLKELYTRYFADRKEYLDEFRKYERQYLEGMKSLYDSALSGISKLMSNQIDGYNEAKEAAVSALEEERDARLEVIDVQKEQLEAEQDLIDKRIEQKQEIIDSIQKEIDAMKEAREERQRQLDLQKAQYELERMQNQRTILQYNEEKGMHYVTNTKGTREAKEKVDDAKFDIDVAKKEKEIKLIEEEIDLLEEQKEAIQDQIDALDKQAEQIEKYYSKLISEQEKYFDSMIKNMEQQKSKWEELADIQEIAEAYSAIEQVFGELGYSVEDILNGSESAFEDFKSRYIAIMSDMNQNTSFQEGLEYASGVAKENFGSIVSDAHEAAQELSNTFSDGTFSQAITQGVSDGIVSAKQELDKMDQLGRDASDGLMNGWDEKSNLFIEAAKQTAIDAVEAFAEGQDSHSPSEAYKEKAGDAIAGLLLGVEENKQSFIDTIRSLAEDGVLAFEEGFNFENGTLNTSFDGLKLLIESVTEALGFGTEGTVGGLLGALDQLSKFSFSEDSIIKQFNNLKSAIDEVTTAIGGGSESSGSEGQSGSSGKGNESGGKSSEGGNGNSLTSAITEMGNTANEVIGEPEAEGDGTVIGEFSSMKTAVNDVTSAIGGGDSEGGESSGSEDDGNLIDSITDLGTTTEETLGESGGNGVIGKFEELKQPIQEANEHVHGISDGLAAIDGQEVECTIKVNIETTGGLPAFAEGTLGNMNLESGEYTAQYGKAFAEGTGKYKGLPNDEKNALVSEYGQTEMTVLPNGNTIITDEPTMMDLPKGTVIYNEDQTKQIMDNKVDINGKAYADGTDDDAPHYPSQEILDFTKRMKKLEMQHELIANYTYGVLSPLHDIKQNTENMISNISSVSNVTNNNKNVQQPVVNHISVTLPNVTNSTSAESLLRDLESLNTKKYQVDW